MTEADIGMTEHRSKNTLSRSVSIKTKTDVEEDGTSEDGSPRPVCISKMAANIQMQTVKLSKSEQRHANRLKKKVIIS